MPKDTILPTVAVVKTTPIPDSVTETAEAGTTVVAEAAPEPAIKIEAAPAKDAEAQTKGFTVTQAQIAASVKKQLDASQNFTLQGKTISQVYAALIGQESGGRQFGQDGSVLRSDKDALGAAQIIPTTAPSAAKLAGLPWNENQYKNDIVYNKALGLAYLVDRVKRFDGNVTLALMGYNAGITAVNDRIHGTNKSTFNPRKLKLGRLADGNFNTAKFVRQFPVPETRGYVDSIYSKLGLAAPIAPTSVAKAAPANPVPTPATTRTVVSSAAPAMAAATYVPAPLAQPLNGQKGGSAITRATTSGALRPITASFTTSTSTLPVTSQPVPAVGTTYRGSDGKLYQQVKLDL